MNKVILIGFVGQDPETRETEKGKVSSFSLATKSFYKKEEHTDWHKIVTFSHLADAAQNYVKKGSQIAIEGRIKNRSYEHNGEKKYITEIIANDLKLLGKKQIEAEAEGIPF